MAAPWFHLDPLPESGVVLLAKEEAKHATGARRLGEGDAVVLFDGRGSLATATLLGTRDRRGDVEARIDSIERREPIAPRIELATALPKGDRLSTLLDMATQVGVDHVIPLRCEWGVVKPHDEPPDRWQRIAIESAKQSRRAWVPTFGAPMSVAAACRGGEGVQVLIAHPDGVPIGATIDAWSLRSGAGGSPSAVRVLIGPEGGFSDGELAAAKTAGVTRVSLSPHVLRIETAAAMAAALLRDALSTHPAG
jgi:16S rRNA (uracil1498-N3)-methyltransferase